MLGDDGGLVAEDALRHARVGAALVLDVDEDLAVAEREGRSRSKGEDGKGAKPVGKFVRFTDSALLTTLVNKLPDLGLYMAMMPVPMTVPTTSAVVSVKVRPRIN